ncbi:hypothetical protein [Janthinobacterium sp.]|uniref:hypothetical protein n=1 Tax=Janthinobacterium sp. TaxID=1871054 RepID=UPI00262016C5|nr:hypothetical protein [Janthinobacterium sp.]
MLFNFEIAIGLDGVAAASFDGFTADVFLTFGSGSTARPIQYKIAFGGQSWASAWTREQVLEDAVRIAIAQYSASFNKPAAPLHFTATQEMGRWPGSLERR